LREKFDPSDLLSIKQAAELRGVTMGTISHQITAGRFTPVEIGGKRYLRRSEVEAFTRQKSGPKPGKRPAAGRKRGEKKK
jgi:excisionase family DNA binding protein